MSTISLRLPGSLHERARELAEGEHLDQPAGHVGAGGENLGADDGGLPRRAGEARQQDEVP